jgi:hypothetical protein
MSEVFYDHLSYFRTFRLVKYLFMLAVAGTYQNGYVKLDKPVSSENPVRIIITFLDEIAPTAEKKLSLSDFSFAESRKTTSGFSGSFSDALIEERRSEL